MYPHLRRLLAICTVALVASACQDAPTAPSTDVTEREGRAAETGSGSVPNWERQDRTYSCSTSVRSASGPTRYRRVAVRFSAHALAADGSTLKYRFQFQPEGSDPILVAACVIPRTGAAVAMMHERFGIDRDARIEYKHAPGSDDASMQSCVGGSGACGLEELIVTAGGCTNPDWTRGDDGVCRSDRGGSGGGTGGLGAGGTDWGGGGGNPEEPPLIAPEGVDQDDFEKLNRAEQLLCVLSPNECAAVIVGGHEASEWAREKTPELLNAEGDNKRDALRHALWQAILARVIGAERGATRTKLLRSTRCLLAWISGTTRLEEASEPPREAYTQEFAPRGTTAN